MKKRIAEILGKIINPETETDIISDGIVDSIVDDDHKITVALRFQKHRNPFALKIKDRVEEILNAEFPDKSITVFIKEKNDIQHKNNNVANDIHDNSTVGAIKHIVAIASGKGGVGKSTVTSNLAVVLHNMGYKIGVLDADIYGPSQSKMFGVEDYIPDVENSNGVDYIVPAEKYGVKLISIAMFIKSTDALLWRGTMANSALRQLIHQTKWGELDFLLIDLPPGTGDIHLSIISELNINGAIIVSTPQQVAVADVVRGVEMFRNPNINIPILGIIENMAWFTPKELPDNRYYIFGNGGASRYAKETGVDTIGEIPIIQSVMQCGDDGIPASATDKLIEKFYRHSAEIIVNKLNKSVNNTDIKNQ